MNKICIITKKKTKIGNRRSKSMKSTKRKFLPNLHFRKFWVEKKKNFLKMKISPKGIKMLDKIGIKKFIKKYIK